MFAKNLRLLFSGEWHTSGGCLRIVMSTPVDAQAHPPPIASSLYYYLPVTVNFSFGWVGGELLLAQETCNLLQPKCLMVTN